MKKLFIIFCIFLSTNVTAMDYLTWKSIAEVASKIKKVGDECSDQICAISNKLGVASKALENVTQMNHFTLIASSAALGISGLALWQYRRLSEKINSQENQISKLSKQLFDAQAMIAKKLEALKALQQTEAKASAGRHRELCNVQKNEAKVAADRHTELVETLHHEQECFVQFQLALEQNTHYIHQQQKVQSEAIKELGSKVKKQQQATHNKLNKIKYSLDALQSELTHEFIEVDHKLQEFSESIQLLRQAEANCAADRHAELNQWLQKQHAYLGHCKKSLEQIIQLQVEDTGIQAQNNQKLKKLKKQQNDINSTLVTIENSLNKFGSELGKAFVGLNENQIKMVDAVKMFAETFGASNEQAIDTGNQVLGLIHYSQEPSEFNGLLRSRSNSF